MKLEDLTTVGQLTEFLSGTQAVAFSVISDKDDGYRWIQGVLVKFRYHRLGKQDKGVVIRYLMKISGYSRQQITRLMQSAGPTTEQAQRLDKIDTSSQHLLAIINDILDLSKIEAGKLTLEQSDFHLDAIFDQIQSLLNQQLSARGLTIEVDLNDVPHWLQGDLVRLRQALFNYVGNAIKFTEQGTTIFLRARKLEENDDGILVRFEVADTGIGIEPAKLSGLFEAFEKADASTRARRANSQVCEIF